MSDASSRSAPVVAIAVLLFALLTSGLASIINQVVWQRALKVYLAGSEAISAMIVVLVFMAGLGLGSYLMSRYASRIRHPLLALFGVEVLLAMLNGGICYALSLDIAETIYAFQRVVVSIGVPLRVLYALSAAVVLVLPCVLMGMTVPIASEALQKQLGRTDNRLLALLFLLNTVGALFGSLASGFWILPYLGQRVGLLIAIAFNATAGILALALARSYGPVAGPQLPQTSTVAGTVLRHELLMGFALGLISLAYEMYLFRTSALVFRPKPWVFSMVLAGFLLTWSLGVYVGGRTKEQIRPTLAWTAASLALVPMVYRMARWSDWGLLSIELSRLLYLGFTLVPCIGFGLLFTQLVTRFADSWGEDVGRYYAFNTVGSCVGILAVSLVGTEFAPFWTVLVLALASAALLPLFDRAEAARGQTSESRLSFAGVGVVGLLAVAYAGLWLGNGRRFEGQLNGVDIVQAYYGKSGVVEMDATGNLIWDGLWHSSLSDGTDHIGSANWLLGVVPVFAMDSREPVSAAVIGLGTGVTAKTVARSDRVSKVDVYEINEDLGRMMADHPDGTLRVAEDDEVTLFWQDGRSGLALRDRSYGLITQQPLWLVQAGSSILLSREYMELVRSRLAPGGVFTVYTNTKADGVEQQARIVRRTASEVFAFCESFGDGYMVVCSDSPIRFDAATLRERLALESTLADEVASWTLDKLVGYVDATRKSWKSEVVLTDDHPVVEYPSAAEALSGTP